MNIDLPSDGDASNDDSVFGGRIDLYEAYWLYVDGVRYTSAVLERSEATKEDEDHSPLARHHNHFYEKKEQQKEKCRDLPGNLPKYKEYFKEPQGNVRKIPREEFQKHGIEWEEGDDPIWLPPEYELPSVWEDDLKGMEEPELRELVGRLRQEAVELREERDDLRERLVSVRQSLSNYLDELPDVSSSQPGDSSQSPKTCESCGRTFETKAARHGHKPHCDGITVRDGRGRAKTKSARPLEQLAKELPELSEQQLTSNHDALSAEEELENLNHLLSKSL